MTHSRKIALKVATLVTLCGLTGCTFDGLAPAFREGDRSLPNDLRSSSDRGNRDAPRVAMAATQPVGAAPEATLTQTLVQLPARAINLITGRSPVAAALDLDHPNPDRRRQAIYSIVKQPFGKGLPYTDVYRSMALLDTDQTVRAAAVRALSRSNDPGAKPVLIRALSDGHPSVRLEAAKALSNIPDAAAEAPLRRMVANRDETWDVRIAAADALRHYKSLDTSRTLVSQLNGENFALAWQSRRSLYRITDGSDFRYDEAGWLGFLTQN
jgi:HEAT repeats